MAGKFLLVLIILYLFPARGVLATNTQTDWPMAGADPQRTSHNNVEVVRPAVEWYRVIDPYVDAKVQVIVGGGKVFLSTSKGLVTFDAKTGAQLWFFGTELPPGHSPTYVSATNTVYLPGFDHRIRALNANSGSEIAGYNPYEAGAGFETNPLVINNVIYAGNRDGYFYALDANNGSLKWRYQTGGPIRFSAAISKDNSKIFFASEDSYGYALNANTGALIWKTPKLPGYGFATFWPVVWTDTIVTPNKEYVMFTASQKTSYALPISDGETTDRYFNQNVAITWDCVSANVSYLWAAGTATLNCPGLYNYYSTIRPDRRNLFIFASDQGSTAAVEYRDANGNFSVPINWQGAANGGNKYPPTIGLDGVIYTDIGRTNGANGGSRGWISGWKFGTSYISNVYTPGSGAADEPVAFTSGGKYIYWAEMINADAVGSVDITKPVGSNLNPWAQDPRWVNGANSKYSDNSGNPSLALSATFNGSGTANKINGVYSIHDGIPNMSPVPYNAGDHSRLYLIHGNVLFALSNTGGGSQLSTVMAPATLNPANITLPPLEVINKLNSEITKIIASGHLRPGFADSGYLSSHLNSGYAYNGCTPLGGTNCLVAGDHLLEYFHTPGETVTALAMAMPYLSDSLKNNVKTYLQTNYGLNASFDLTKIAHTGWKNGAFREAYPDTLELTSYFTGNAPPGGWLKYSGPSQTQILNISCCGNAVWINVGNFPPDAPYAAWKYAQALNLSGAELTNLITATKGVLQVPGSGNHMTDANLQTWPYLLNQYLAGYKGMIELQKMANQTPDSSTVSTYNRLLSLRVNNFQKNAPAWDMIVDYAPNRVLNTARNFMFMTPELGLEMNASNRTAVQSALEEYYSIEPYWFVAHYERSYEEGWWAPLWSRSALFLGKAQVLKQSYSELVKYLDVPFFEKGDLFWIQNAVATLDAANATPPVSGDLNGDGKVDILDLRLAIKNFTSVFDLTMVLANYGN